MTQRNGALSQEEVLDARRNTNEPEQAEGDKRRPECPTPDGPDSDKGF